MKPIVKILFAALIICVSLVLPKTTHASSGMTCQSPGVNQCLSGLTSELYQCIGTCIYQGNGAPTTTYSFCYPTVSCSPVWSTTSPGTVAYWACGAGTACTSVPSTNPSCTQSCVNTYNPQLNSCYTQYCSYE
jgi:hypothetical protein